MAASFATESFRQLTLLECASVSRVRVHKLNENADGNFEPRTDLNQPAGGLPV